MSTNEIYSNASKPTYVGAVYGGANRAKSTIKRERIKYALFSDLAYAKQADRAGLLKSYDKKGKWQYDADMSTRDIAVFRSDRTGEVVIAARGTDLRSKDTRLRDLSTDIGIVFGVSKFGKRNATFKKIARAVEDKYGTRPTLTGHSLGGRVASDVAKDLDYKGVVYNAGSSPSDWVPKMVSRLGQMMGISKPKTSKVSHHRTKYDPVSASAKMTTESDQLHEIDPESKLGAHSLKEFIPDNEDEAQIGTGKRRPNRWIKHVKAYRSKHPEMSYKLCLKNASKTY